MTAEQLTGKFVWIPALILTLLTLPGLIWLEGRSESSFQRFAEKGDVSKLQKRIAAGTDVNTLGRHGFTALACAVRGGQDEAVDILLNAGADVLQPSTDGNTPLHMAIQQENLKLVDLLLEKGADPHYENQKEFSPFHMAVELNSPAVELFLARGVEPGGLKLARSGGYLFCSSQSGCMPVLSRILDQGADVNGLSATGATALHYAIYGGKTNVVQVLLDHGADVNGRDRRQSTPLHQAVRAGSAEVVQMLLENGADLEARNRDGYTPLLLAAQIGHLEDVRELLKRGADIDAVDDEQRTMEGLAYFRHHAEVLEFIKTYRQQLRQRGKNYVRTF